MASDFQGPEETTKRLRQVLDDDSSQPWLGQFVTELYMACLSTEEGQVASASLVLIADRTKIEWSDTDYRWTVFWFEEPRSLRHLRKLAHVCRPGDTYLVASLPEKESALWLCGLAVPPRRYPPRGLALAMARQDPERHSSRAPEFLRASIRGPARGGLILVQGPEHASARISRLIGLDTDASISLNLADLYEDAYASAGYSGQKAIEVEYSDAPTFADLSELNRLEEVTRAADARFVAAIQTTARMAAADGAVLLSNHLTVYGLGAVVPVDANVQRRLSAEAIYEKQRPCPSPARPHVGVCLSGFVLEERGTKHQAAAAFVLEDPTSLSIVVSHDGDAAIFIWWSECLVYWRVQVRPEWSDHGVNDMI